MAPDTVSNWKAGPLRIDPLATLQTLERYMVVRGIGRPDQVHMHARTHTGSTGKNSSACANEVSAPSPSL